jgi:hypothetical protein
VLGSDGSDGSGKSSSGSWDEEESRFRKVMGKLAIRWHAEIIAEKCGIILGGKEEKRGDGGNESAASP